MKFVPKIIIALHENDTDRFYFFYTHTLFPPQYGIRGTNPESLIKQL